MPPVHVSLVPAHAAGVMAPNANSPSAATVMKRVMCLLLFIAHNRFDVLFPVWYGRYDSHNRSVCHGETPRPVHC